MSWEVLNEDEALVLVGLDGEMSAAELEDGGRLIQAGFAMRTPQGVEVFEALIAWGDEMLWDPRAALVHGLLEEDVRVAQTPAEVDDAAYEWLMARGAIEGRRQMIAVGFNVGAFDLPFFRQAMPRTMSLISRRSLDLNAVCFAFDGWDPKSNDSRSWSGWKRSAKKAAARALDEAGIVGSEHSAGYDAALAVGCIEYLRREARFESVKRDGRDIQMERTLRNALGDRLAERLDGVDEQVLRAVCVRLLDEGRDPSKWFGTRRSDLGDRAPLQALLDGDTDAVLRLVSPSI